MHRSSYLIPDTWDRFTGHTKRSHLNVFRPWVRVLDDRMQDTHFLERSARSVGALRLYSHLQFICFGTGEPRGNMSDLSCVAVEGSSTWTRMLDALGQKLRRDSLVSSSCSTG